MVLGHIFYTYNPQNLFEDKKMRSQIHPSHHEPLSEISTKLIRLILKMPIDEQNQLYQSLIHGQSDKVTIKREHPRKNYFMTADCVIDERLHHGYIKNISPSGLFIEMESPKELDRGVPVMLTFSHPDCKDYVKTKGRIARVEKNGIGVHLNDSISFFN